MARQVLLGDSLGLCSSRHVVANGNNFRDIKGEIFTKVIKRLAAWRTRLGTVTNQQRVCEEVEAIMQCTREAIQNLVDA